MSRITMEAKKESRETAKTKITPPALPWMVRLQVLALEPSRSLAISPNAQTAPSTASSSLSPTVRPAPARLRTRAACAPPTSPSTPPGRPGPLGARLRHSGGGLTRDGTPSYHCVLHYFHGGGFVFLSPASTPLDDISRHFCSYAVS
jgi:acetyl esterase/lipase